MKVERFMQAHVLITDVAATDDGCTVIDDHYLVMHALVDAFEIAHSFADTCGNVPICPGVE